MSLAVNSGHWITWYLGFLKFCFNLGAGLENKAWLFRVKSFRLIHVQSRQPLGVTVKLPGVYC